jgi:hypothetical protein
LLTAFGDLLDHLVAVHRPVGEQLEDRGTHVTAPAASAATGSAAAASARSTGTARAEAAGTEAEAATRAEATGTECRSETEATGVAAAAVFTDVVAEVATGLSALFVLDAAVSGTESESWTTHEWALELTLWGSFIEWGAHVCVLLSTGNAEMRFRYVDDISETIAMQLLI